MNISMYVLSTEGEDLGYKIGSRLVVVSKRCGLFIVGFRMYGWGDAAFDI